MRSVGFEGLIGREGSWGGAARDRSMSAAEGRRAARVAVSIHNRLAYFTFNIELSVKSSCRKSPLAFQTIYIYILYVFLFCFNILVQ